MCSLAANLWAWVRSPETPPAPLQIPPPISHEKEVDVESSHSVCLSVCLSQPLVWLLFDDHVHSTLHFLSFVLRIDLSEWSLACIFWRPCLSSSPRELSLLAFLAGRSEDTSLSDKTLCMCWRVTAALWHTSVLLQFSSLYQLLWASNPKLPDHLETTTTTKKDT